MTTLVENPMPIILFGIVVEAVLGIILVSTGRGVLLWAMGGVLILVLAGVGLEWLVVTDVERVEAVVEGAAAALGANDQDGLLEYVHPSATEVRRRVDEGFALAAFTSAKITRLEVRNINYLTSPPTAKVQIAGMIHFRVRRGEYPYDSYPIKELTLELHLESGRWLITGYEWPGDPRGR